MAIKILKVNARSVGGLFDALHPDEMLSMDMHYNAFDERELKEIAAEDMDVDEEFY